ncbi:MAG: cell envelope integrity protein CreD [Flavobacteriales bacterium]
MKSFVNSIYFKLFAIGILALLLLIPTAMIEGLVRDRENIRDEAVSEVSSKWGYAQTLTGPFISIPYTRYTVTETTNGKTIVSENRERLHILPENLSVSGDILPEIRKRGIYEIPVYTTDVQISGDFNLPDLSTLDVPLTDLEFDKAELVLGVTDLRGIQSQIEVAWDDKRSFFSPGTPSNDVVYSGLHTPIGFTNDSAAQHRFTMNVSLRGSGHLFVVPMGKVTDVALRSSWPDPKFNGAFLPTNPNPTSEGFEAQWSVFDLNRNFPQWWTNNGHSVEDASFGVELLVPVDDYQKTYRSIHYAILFIGLTFMVFFFIEVSKKVHIHSIQYLLVGMALVVFYTLLLSLSEHIDYNFAFGLAAGATIALITGYVKAVLKSGPLTLLIAGILSVLYGFIFVVIQLQDLALLIGSIGIFLILALTMYFSRKIDWSSARSGDA